MYVIIVATQSISNSSLPKRDLDVFDIPGLALVAIFTDIYPQISLRYLRSC